ncbi:MAG TPA: DUF433 domain-containing protein [Stellaceae bacterium]|nr:DUF433 domain-containing protein [Stellaceae bacterium]
METYSEETTSRLTGVSVHQLRYWDADGFFSPSFGYEDRSKPYSRVYSFRDLVALKVLNALRNDAKIALSHLREVKEQLLLLGEKLWGETTLYVHHKRVVFVNPETDRLEEVVSGQGVLQIPLVVASSNMREAIKLLNQRKPETIGKLERRRKIADNQLVIAGTRVPVENVKAFADQGYSVDQIKLEYPTLTEDDIRAAINYDAAA